MKFLGNIFKFSLLFLAINFQYCGKKDTPSDNGTTDNGDSSNDDNSNGDNGTGGNSYKSNDKNDPGAIVPREKALKFSKAGLKFTSIAKTITASPKASDQVKKQSQMFNKHISDLSNLLNQISTNNNASIGENIITNINKINSLIVKYYGTYKLSFVRNNKVLDDSDINELKSAINELKSAVK